MVEALVELVAEGAREAGDFAGAFHHFNVHTRGQGIRESWTLAVQVEEIAGQWDRRNDAKGGICAGAASCRNWRIKSTATGLKIPPDEHLRAGRKAGKIALV